MLHAACCVAALSNSLIVLFVSGRYWWESVPFQALSGDAMATPVARADKLFQSLAERKHAGDTYYGEVKEI